MTNSEDLPEHVRRNREAWDQWAVEYVASAERNWRTDEPTWGIWGIPESEVGMLEGISGLDAIELGCGTAYVSAWLARRGARPVGIDNSPNQLETARRLQREHGLEFPLLLGNAEAVPYPDGSFDLAISEYGACLWADPYRWVPEAARLLRQGGRLRFLTNTALLALCSPDGEDPDEPVVEHLLRPASELYRKEWVSDPSVDFHLLPGEWIRLLREHGFEIEALKELYPAQDATTRYPYVPLAWARKWPSEEVWFARKRG
jgi:SAM-dependent methyltransferase